MHSRIWSTFCRDTTSAKWQLTFVVVLFNTSIKKAIPVYSKFKTKPNLLRINHWISKSGNEWIPATQWLLHSSWKNKWVWSTQWGLGHLCRACEDVFYANCIEEDKRGSILLTCVGAKTYELLKSLTAPAKPSEKSYKEIVNIVKNHLSPKALVTGERCRFWKRNQNLKLWWVSFFICCAIIEAFCNMRPWHISQWGSSW